MIYLDDPTLGRVDIRPLPEGIVPTQLTIGFPEVAEVIYPKALANGVDDRSRYLRQRAITLSVRLDQRLFSTQSLLDRVLPFMDPKYRPRLVYSLAENPIPTEVRAFRIRGVDAPFILDGPKYQALVMQWVTADHRAKSLQTKCELVRPGGEGEEGRTYNLEHDRVYPASLPSGAKIITNKGNTGADWIGTIVAGIQNPTLDINGVRIEFPGLNLIAPTFIEIDTEARTIFRNGDPTDSIYGVSNFADWEWEDLLLNPGDNIIRYQGDEPTVDTSTTICWQDSFL